MAQEVYYTKCKAATTVFTNVPIPIVAGVGEHAVTEKVENKKELKKKRTSSVHKFTRALVYRDKRQANAVQSHLVKHTANIVVSSRRIPITVRMVVMQLATPSHAHASLPGRPSTCGHASVGSRDPCGCCCSRTSRTSHLTLVLCLLNLFSIANFGHSPNASTSESWILITVAPAIYGALNQASLPSQTRV